MVSMTNRIRSILDRKRQVILYGPPGTGKTYWAKRAAKGLADSYKIVSFHPSYGYEDFIEGYRPEVQNGKLKYILKDGIFKEFCSDAELDAGRKYCLIIDEINRGDVTRIFGELITLLEIDKRNNKYVYLPFSGEKFSVPDNIYLIATMNTADRSISLLDTALRRRFGFIEMMPDYSVLKGSRVGGIQLETLLGKLNSRICEHLPNDGRNYQIGHSFFLDDTGEPIRDTKVLESIFTYDIIPTIKEYTYGDPQTLERILGKDLIEHSNRRSVCEDYELINILHNLIN